MTTTGINITNAPFSTTPSAVYNIIIYLVSNTAFIEEITVTSNGDWSNVNKKWIRSGPTFISSITLGWDEILTSNNTLKSSISIFNNNNRITITPGNSGNMYGYKISLYGSIIIENDNSWTSNTGFSDINVDSITNDIFIKNTNTPQLNTSNNIYIVINDSFLEMTWNSSSSMYEGNSNIILTEFQNAYNNTNDIILYYIDNIRPLNPKVGNTYFDPILNKPIWYGQSGWVDSSGLSV